MNDYERIRKIALVLESLVKKNSILPEPVIEVLIEKRAFFGLEKSVRSDIPKEYGMHEDRPNEGMKIYSVLFKPHPS